MLVLENREPERRIYPAAACLGQRLAIRELLVLRSLLPTEVGVPRRSGSPARKYWASSLSSFASVRSFRQLQCHSTRMRTKEAKRNSKFISLLRALALNHDFLRLFRTDGEALGHLEVLRILTVA